MPDPVDFWFDFPETENWWEPADAGPDFDVWNPVIDLSEGGHEADFPGADQLFVDTTTGDLVAADGTVIMSSTDFADAQAALEDFELRVHAPNFDPSLLGSLLNGLERTWSPISNFLFGSGGVAGTSGTRTRGFLNTPLGQTLVTLGLGGLGTAIGAAVAGDSRALQQLARRGGPVLPPALQVGQARLQAALEGTGGPLPPVGSATAGENFQAAVANAFAAQRRAGEYFTDELGRSITAEGIEAPQFDAIRRRAIARLPSTYDIQPGDRSALEARLIARANTLLTGGLDKVTDPSLAAIRWLLNEEIAAGPEPVDDPVGADLRAWAQSLIATGRDAGTPNAVVPATPPEPLEPTVADRNRLAAVQQVRDNLRSGRLGTDPNYLFQVAHSLLSPAIPGPAAAAVARQIVAGTYVDPLERPAAQTRTPGPPSAPSTSSLSTAPLEDPYQAGIGAELQRALDGKVANALLERQIIQGRETLMNQLRQQLGTNTPELTTAGAQRLAEYDFAATAMVEQDRRAVIAAYSPLEQSRRQFNTTFPEDRFQRRVSIALPEERIRTQFAAEFPETRFRNRIATLAPEERLRTQFNFRTPRTLRLDELNSTVANAQAAERFGESRRAARFDETSRLTSLGRRPVIASAAAASGILPVAGLTGINSAEESSRAAFQAAMNAATQRDANNNATATNIARLFAQAFGALNPQPLIFPRAVA